MYILFCLLIFICLLILQSSFIHFDSVSDTNNIPDTNLNFKDKIKSWCYWQVFIKNSSHYEPYSNFKSSWNHTYTFKEGFVTEWSDLKSNPWNYVKAKWEFRLNRLEAQDDMMNAYYKSTRYIEGHGWISKAELNGLHKTGYTVINSKIVDIRKH